MMQDYEIINADCLRAMQEMPDGCVDAIVTDPPYGLAFMGANWDHNVPSVSYWSECLRVAKPGTHLLCFGGTRTFHRLACSLEDAGWEIRDCIMWVYGSGFPHSMDVAKAIDKALGAKRPVVGHSDHGSGPWQGKLANHGRGDTGIGIFDGSGRSFDITAPATDAAAQWNGWGTCLKPAWEPIIVARKPLDGTVAHNVLTWGVGALNIDACRVPTEDKLGGGMRGGSSTGQFDRPWMHDECAQEAFVERKKANVAKSEELGRFPANLVHDGSQEVLELFPEANCGKSGVIKHKKDGVRSVYGDFSPFEQITTVAHGGKGSAARFFYCAKASKRDRGEGNDHPTVKPNALMRWLVRLVCPQGGTVLDPFMGSGSTGVACIQEGMEFVGIDMDEHYCEIANTRISKETGKLFCERQ